MSKTVDVPIYHINTPDWLTTREGQPRGYIQPKKLSELWFHTGTICNLECPFCLEGSKPGDRRLETPTLEDVRPFVEEALELGALQFSFTGGEPFVNRDFTQILDLALDHRPCMVLTNATEPLRGRLDGLLPLLKKPYALRLRVSLDYPDPARHDAGRGAGKFELALDTMGKLHAHGFKVSAARLGEKDEDQKAIDEAYLIHFERVGLPGDTHIQVFPDFLTPGAHPGGVPEITENCMRTYHTEASRAAFMCSFSKMIVKKDGRMRVYACTLVDDDADYDLGGSLLESMGPRVMLRHHRCFSCFAYGASCSE